MDFNQYHMELSQYELIAEEIPYGGIEKLLVTEMPIEIIEKFYSDYNIGTIAYLK